jgi:hypothetical protein
LKEYADSIGCKVVRLKKYDGKNSERIGIHLLRPDQRELEDALNTAERDMFPAIYIHTFDSWTPGNMKMYPKAPEYYNRNGGRCIRVLPNRESDTVSLLVVTAFGDYGVWHGCNPKSGETLHPELTRCFDRKADAMAYLKSFGKVSVAS